MSANYNLLKQNNNLTNYYYYSTSLSNEEIEKIIQLSKIHSPVKGNVQGTVDLNYRKSEITWLPNNKDTEFIYNKLVDLAKDANSKMWNFNITNLFDNLQFTEYTYNPEDKQQSHYDWHMDFGRENTSTRKLSCSIQLSDSDDYEGCDLEFMIHRNITKAPRKKGSIIFFPSYITHRVTEITKGKRQSLVIWFHGPPFV
jgi:PKHD-type hydroxylase